MTTWSVAEGTGMFGPSWQLIATDGGVSLAVAMFTGAGGEQLAKRCRDLLQRNGLDDVALPASLMWGPPNPTARTLTPSGARSDDPTR